MNFVYVNHNDMLFNTSNTYQNTSENIDTMLLNNDDMEFYLFNLTLIGYKKVEE